MSQPMIYGYFVRINDSPVKTVETSKVFRGDFGGRSVSLMEFDNLWDNLTYGHCVMYSRRYIDPGFNRFI